jgi:iron complex outermembrane receptor protein
VLIALLVIAAQGQADRPVTWEQDLNYLAGLAPADAVAQQDAIARVRTEVEGWLKLHPESKISLAAAPSRPWDQAQTLAQIHLLHDAVASIMQADPSHPFHLGAVQVNVTASVSELSTLSDSIDQTEMAKRNEVNAALAMENLPGVSIEHFYSGRNQEQISVHGFNYLQVPLYVDGILMNDPYDGTLDFRQIPTTDIAEIQVAKGFSSPLLGPNAVGGAINIVTKEPQKKYEGEMLIGGYSGDGFLSSIRLGSRMGHYFVQGSLDWMQDDYIPLSGNFVTNVAQPNDQLNYSYSHDAKYTGRVGWTPNGKGEYVFTYLNQKAKDGMPLNTGNDPLNGNDCSPSTLTSATLYDCYLNTGGMYTFRSWAFWDKTTYYFHSDTPLGGKSSIKLRVFYDQYPNLMYFYSPPSTITAPPVYTAAMLNPEAITLYDDHSDGFSTEFDTKLARRNAISGSFFFKDDTHHEVPMITPTSGPTSLRDRQQIASIGLQDVISIAENLTGTVGMSFDHLDGMRATNSSTYDAFVSPQCPTNTNPDDYSACTPHQWAYNPQVSFAYSFKDSGRLFVGFAQKNRFPVLKDMYSFHMGRSIPNPNLKTEHSQNWEIGYSRTFAKNTLAQLEFFRSDLKDAIELIPAPLSLQAVYPGACTSPTNCSVNENASHETHQGAELTLHSTPVQKLTFDANYTYINKEIGGYSFPGLTTTGTEVYPCYSGDYLVTGTGSNAVQTTTPDNTCLTPTDLPKHKAVAMATLRLPLQVMLNSTLRYEGGNKAVDSYSVGSGKNSVYYIEAIPMSHFATWDVGGSVPLYKGAVFQAGVKNLLDRNYYQVLYIPEQGRSWFVNMRYRF